MGGGASAAVASLSKVMLKKRRQTEPPPLSLPSVAGAADKLTVEGEGGSLTWRISSLLLVTTKL